MQPLGDRACRRYWSITQRSHRRQIDWSAYKSTSPTLSVKNWPTFLDLYASIYSIHRDGCVIMRDWTVSLFYFICSMYSIFRLCFLRWRKFVTCTGKLCIEVSPTDKIAFISEELCIGCGICAKASYASFPFSFCVFSRTNICAIVHSLLVSDYWQLCPFNTYTHRYNF